MKSLLLVFFILFFDLIAFTIILPLFPSIVDYYGQHNSDDVLLKYIYEVLEWIRLALDMPDRKRYNNVLVAGILGSMYSFFQFLSSPVIGTLSDVFGRKKLLIISMIGCCLSYIVWWKADTFSLFIVSRVIGGLSKGSVTLCTAIVSDISKKKESGKGMAYIGLAFSCGFISGPLIGAYFASASSQHQHAHVFSLPAQMALVFQLISIVLTWLLLDETNPSGQVISISSCCDKVMKLTNPFRLFTFNGSKEGTSLQQLVTCYFLFLLFFSGLEFTLPFLTHERFSFTGMQQGKLLFFAGVIMMLVQGGYVRRMKANREKKLSLQGILVLIPAMFIFSIASTVQMTYVAISIYSFELEAHSQNSRRFLGKGISDIKVPEGAATVVPCLTSLFTQQSQRSDTGENVGVLRSAGALARAVAPAFSCSVYWFCGSTACYMSGGILFVLPLLLLMRIDFKSQKDDGAKID